MDTAQAAQLQAPSDANSMSLARSKKRTPATVTATEWPDPILTLRHIVGVSNAFPSALLWLRGSSSCIYSSFSTIIIRELGTERESPRDTSQSVDADDDNQSEVATKGGSDDLSSLGAVESFLWGHGAPICGMALTNDGVLLASAEESSSSVRVWDLRRLECVTALNAHAKGVHALCFSSPSRTPRLCAVGRNEAHRVQIIVYDCAKLHADAKNKTRRSVSGALPVVARQTCDFPVSTIAFSPYEADQLVSCGKENVRFWRVRNNHLIGSPVVLNEYSRGTVFTDIAFDPVCEAFPSNLPRTRPLYVSSSLGTLLLINYDTREVVCVYQLHDSAINCLSVNEGFCVTGSEDHFLRVWPLDFSDFFLEAQHEASVASVQVSSDGLRVLVGSRNGAIGMLDIADQRYDTILRSHTSEITTMALTPVSLLSHDDGTVVKRDEIVTTSRDGTLRIWDATLGLQSYEFDVETDEVTCLVVSPVEPNVVAVGFASGCTRIFDIQNGGATSVLREFQQHQSALRSIQYNCDGHFLYTSAAGRQLCMYDAREREYAPIKMLIADMFAASGKFCLSSDKKYIATITADEKSIALLCPRSLRPCATITPSNAQSAHRQSRSAGGGGVASPKGDLKDLLLSGDAQELLVLSKTDRLFVYSMQSLEMLQTMQLLAQGSITSLALTPNRKYLATGSSEGSLCVWRWEKAQRFRRKQQTFVGQTGSITRISFTSDGTSIVATGNSSTLFIWEFHGEAGAASKVGDTTVPVAQTSSRNGCRRDPDTTTVAVQSSMVTRNHFEVDIHGDHDKHDADDPEEMSPSLHVPVPSSKPNFRLSLAMDALVLNHNDVREDDSQERSSNPIEWSTLQLATSGCGSLSVSRVVRGVDPCHVAWSYSSGHLVFAVGSAVVVESIASGAQAVYHSSDESASHDSDTIVQVRLMRLSPSGRRVATVLPTMDAVTVAHVVVPEKQSSESVAHTRSTCRIPLPPGATSVDAMEFVDERSDTDGLLCISYHTSESDYFGLFLASVATGSVVWSSAPDGTRSSNEQWSPSQRVRDIISVGDKTFVTLSGDKCRLELHQLDRNSAPFDSTADSCVVLTRTLLEAFSSPIQITRASPLDPLAGYCRRYLLCVDHQAFCFVFDLAREVIVATSQLMVHRSEQRQPRVSIDFLEWLSTPESKSLVRGSKLSSTLFVHRLPTKLNRTNASVDWQLVARSGLPLLFQIALDSVPRSLSVDPLRGAGVVTTDDGTVSFLVFKDGSPKRIVKFPLNASSVREHTLRDDRHSNALRQRSVCWALGDTVLLTLDEHDSAICCWVPEASREVARFEVRSSRCTAMAVNDLFCSQSTLGSTLLAGYDDGSVRVFDLKHMTLLAQSQLATRSKRAYPRSTRRGADPHDNKQFAAFERKLPTSGDRIEQILFVGACAALAVLADHRALLIDISEVVQTEAQSAAKATKPVHPVRHRPREIAYRELALRRPVGRTRRHAHIALPRVTDLDVKTRVETSFFAPHGASPSATTVFPFLLVTTDTEDGSNGVSERSNQLPLVQVFGWSGMAATDDKELVVTDEWRADSEGSVLARFAPGELPLVLCVSDIHADDSSNNQHNRSASLPSSRVSWCFEVRDYLQQRGLRRIDLSPTVAFTSQPSFMTRIRISDSSWLSAQDNQSVASELMLVADERGERLLALDLEQNQAIPVRNEAAATLGLQLTRQTAFSVAGGTRFALSRSVSDEQLFIADISFQHK